MADEVRILFIDDQQDFLDSISFWMKAKGYKVQVSKDVHKAIGLVREGKVDIVFCDYKMPEMDGIQVLVKIREIDNSIPVVMVTAHADNVLLRDVKTLGISGFFSKIGPFDELDREPVRILDHHCACPGELIGPGQNLHA